VLSIDFGQDVRLSRPGIVFGEKTDVALPDVFGTWTLNTPLSTVGEHGTVWTQSGVFYAYAGTDIRDGDLLKLPVGKNDDGSVRDVKFRVVGDPKWGQPNPIDGEVFGIQKWELVRAG
jgi:hypothetical protein